MTSLLTNNAAMTALTTLKSINSQLDMTSNRVSTGQRVSNASDNAAYWSIATTVRSDNASLGAVKDSLGLGSSAVDTAYNGLNSIITDLQNIRAKLQTALTPGVDRSKVQTEITAIQNKMKATADSSTSSGQNWLSVNSTASNTNYQATQNVVAGFSRDAAGTVTFSKIAVDVNAIKLYDVNASSITTTATSAEVFGATSLTGTDAFRPTATVAAGKGTATFNGTEVLELAIVIDGAAAETLTLDKASLTSAVGDLTKVTTDELLQALNNQIAGNANLKGEVSAGLDSAGRLTFTRIDTGAGQTIQVNTTANNTQDVGFGAGTVTGVEAKGTDAGTTAGRGILDTVDGTTGFSISGFDSSNVSEGINISALVGTSGDLALQDIITQVEQALAKVTDAGTKLGANKTQIDGQKVFVDTLMKANDRTIGVLVDADIEEESTKLKALQTQQQLGVQSLSIANTASQNVLSLFR